MVVEIEGIDCVKEATESTSNYNCLRSDVPLSPEYYFYQHISALPNILTLSSRHIFLSCFFILHYVSSLGLEHGAIRPKLEASIPQAFLLTRYNIISNIAIKTTTPLQHPYLKHPEQKSNPVNNKISPKRPKGKRRTSA
jgi:hypothetical protein